jgi:hypothetical protein
MSRQRRRRGRSAWQDAIEAVLERERKRKREEEGY